MVLLNTGHASMIRQAGLALISAFSQMLLTVTAIWAIRQSGSSSSAVEMGIFWVLLPATFFVWSIILEYLEDGNISRSVRASLLITAGGVAVVVVLLAARYGWS
jgi:hypothetical protein